MILAKGPLGVARVRKLGSVIVWGLIVSSTLATNCFAAPHVMRASALPEPGVLLALGSGLVGLATVIRHRFNR